MSNNNMLNSQAALSLNDLILLLVLEVHLPGVCFVTMHPISRYWWDQVNHPLDHRIHCCHQVNLSLNVSYEFLMSLNFAGCESPKLNCDRASSMIMPGQNMSQMVSGVRTGYYHSSPRMMYNNHLGHSSLMLSDLPEPPIPVSEVGPIPPPPMFSSPAQQSYLYQRK